MALAVVVDPLTSLLLLLLLLLCFLFFVMLLPLPLLLLLLLLLASKTATGPPFARPKSSCVRAVSRVPRAGLAWLNALRHVNAPNACSRAPRPKAGKAKTGPPSPAPAVTTELLAIPSGKCCSRSTVLPSSNTLNAVSNGVLSGANQ